VDSNIALFHCHRARLLPLDFVTRLSNLALLTKFVPSIGYDLDASLAMSRRVLLLPSCSGWTISLATRHYRLHQHHQYRLHRYYQESNFKLSHTRSSRMSWLLHERSTR
jgi:hypothetical protein